MAVKFKEVRDELERSPLTKEELAIVAKVEAYIDKEIKKKFDGGSVSFEPRVIEFNFNPDNPSQYHWDVFKDIKSTRKALMTEELKSRYEAAGWRWKFEQGEDDGPNRPGFDYWILSGKK